MKQEVIDRISNELLPIGVKAVAEAPKARLVAKVNHMDNFGLHFTPVAHNAILDHLIPKMEGKTKEAYEYADWFNYMCNNPNTVFHHGRHMPTNRSLFDALANRAAKAAFSVARQPAKRVSAHAVRAALAEVGAK